MKKIALVISLGMILIWINSCKKDFSIYAPGAPKTIVYGFLDPSQDTQFVKINKTWQGQGNNLEYASVRDSSEYKWEEFNDIRIDEIIDGEVTNTYHLAPIERNDKDTGGLFFAPTYTAYYFVKPEEFVEDALYKLTIDFKNKEDVTAQTDVILSTTGSIIKPTVFSPVKFGVVNNGSASPKTYVARWSKYDNAGLYSASIDIKYKEMVWEDDAHTILVSEEDKMINWDLGERRIEDIVNGEFKLSIDGAGFYDILKVNMEVDPKKTRQLGYMEDDVAKIIDFKLAIANKDFLDFIQINQPSSSIVQERPQYSNVTNGIGIFASRNTIKVSGIRLTESTMNAIPWIEGLNQLNICTPQLFTDITCE